MDLRTCVEVFFEFGGKQRPSDCWIEMASGANDSFRVFVLIIRFLSICSHLSINIFVLKKVDLTLFLDRFVGFYSAISGKAIRWRKRRRKSLPKRAEMW